MPLVLVQYKTGRGLEGLIEKLAVQMPEIVAPALDVPGLEGGDYRLMPLDIDVWCTESGKLDVNTKDLEIIIWAHEYPERRANLGKRRDEIIKGVRSFIDDYVKQYWDETMNREVSGFVWVLLQPTAFGKL